MDGTSELQEAEAVVELNIEQPAELAEPAETGSELATDSPNSEGEQKQEEDSQELAQKAINKQHRKYREEQRRANDLQKRLEDLEAKQKPDLSVSDIPPIPDSWDENYEGKIKERDEAILRKAKNDALLQQQSEFAEREKQEKQRIELESAQKRNDQFLENAKKLGVDNKSLMDAQKAVIDYGVTPGIADVLLDDPEGALMLQHLAANPLELYDIVNASPELAGFKMAEVKQKAAALRPKPTSAPDPATTLDGRGVPPKERGPQGAIFE
jgi:hypothetical protein